MVDVELGPVEVVTYESEVVDGGIYPDYDPARVVVFRRLTVRFGSGPKSRRPRMSKKLGGSHDLPNGYTTEEWENARDAAALVMNERVRAHGLEDRQ